MPDKKIIVRYTVLGYWIDHNIKKAYCVIQYLDLPQDSKHTNIFFLESEYNDR